MPLGYETVVVRHLVSGQKLELYAADAVQYLEHPWFSQYYIIDGPIPLSGTAAIISGASGNATKVVNNGLSGTASIVSGASGTVSARRSVSGAAAIVSGASGNVDFPPGITAAFQQSGFSATDGTSYTFSAVPIGTASSTRRCVVSFGWAAGSALTLTSVTIGGVSATVDADTGTLTGNRRLVLCSAVVPTGTTADIVATLSGTAARAGYSLATLTGGSPTGQTDTSVDALSDSLSVTTSTGDVVIGAVIATHNANTTVIGTTGLDTEWYNELFSDGSQYYRHAGGVVVATGASAGFSFTITNSTQRGAVAAAYA